MALIGKKLRSLQGGAVAFRCPGCGTFHQVGIAPPAKPVWGYNGNPDAPTFSPSVKVTYPANPKASEKYAEWRRERICHSFIRDGRIQFLSDCTHELAGQTVELPDLEGG